MRDRDIVLNQDVDLLLVDDDTMRGEDIRAEQAVAGEQARCRRPGRLDEPGDRCPGAAAVAQVPHLRLALGDVRRYRQTEVVAGPEHRGRDAVRGVRRHTDPHALGLERRDALAQRRKVRHRLLRVGAEHLEIDDRPQPELGRRNRRRTAVAAVADRGDTACKQLRRTEPCDVGVLVPTDPPLALGVEPDPFGEVGEPVAEAAVRGVLQVRVRVYEPRRDHRLRVPNARPDFLARPDRGDPAVLDRDRAVGDRLAFDRQNPVRGEDVLARAHRDSMLAGSGSTSGRQRRSKKPESPTASR